MSESKDPGGDPATGGRASAQEAVASLSKKLGSQRKFSLPQIPWALFLQIGVIALVVLPVFWVFIYRFTEAPATLLMGERWLQGQNIRHQNVQFTDMSPNIIRAVIAAEDARFCSHDGFDMVAIQAAYASNQKSSNQAKGKVRGGSTISQQTAKNLFTFADRTFIRKGLETYFTFLTEHIWDKKRIMQGYLNAAEWGDGVFGVQSAAWTRFHVSAGELSPRQAALLAAVLPSPNKWSATEPGPYVRRRAASIEARMYAVGMQGLDRCVLGAYKGAPVHPGPLKPLPPLPALPPDVAAASDAPIILPAPGDAPIDVDSVSPIMTPSFSDGSLEEPAPEKKEEAAPPADQATPPQ